MVIRIIRARGGAAEGAVADLRRRQDDRSTVGRALKRMGAILSNPKTTEDLEIKIDE